MEEGKYTVINIRRFIENNNPQLDENILIQILSDFSCPKNPDVEYFLKNNSIEFTKKNQSVTYLVFLSSTTELIGYFTLALKSLTVKGKDLSNSVKKKLRRVSELDEKYQTYTMSAYLIAQLGKNFSGDAETKVTGAELLELAWIEIKKMQYIGGGMVTFLEAENKEKLLSFYETNHFQPFNTRQTLTGAQGLHDLVQLLRLL